MSGKTGKKPTGRKPLTTTRTSAKTEGAFGKETINQLVTETERNEKRALSQRHKLSS
jgi:hypothetical protein